MARTMTPILKSYLDHAVGTGFAAKLITLINSGHTALDAPTRNSVAKLLDGIGEATAFEASCAANSSITGNTAQMNRLEHELGGRGNAEELALCVADGTIT